eukprot:CAMPEP_0118695558 /NCGR_PEP_ID=MMETSP0800-20121206/13263_1 /TAXON_ID=210618 ORGANISM="Striatella unipunctata, Strain CCMP2910" /NCGR_SAMPLE_ID=MMETSP0800 /ASSEMBLY_ACC=CAM_ASM_000638 /LENGTH=250 /DNA_ID=CAMNT_0006594383 /DNA_START=81 /DNA_END=833 /DNA_ORIENTATION=+
MSEPVEGLTVMDKAYVFLRDSYGAFVGFTVVLVVLLTCMCCIAREIFHLYFGWDVCADREQRRAQRLMADAQMAARMQMEWNIEEEREARLKQQEIRQKLYEKILSKSTMTVDNNSLSSAKDNELVAKQILEGCQTHEDETLEILTLPVLNEKGESRYVLANCAICITEYRAGDHVTWATNTDCGHVFHHECIVKWLAKGTKRCPCCRQYFTNMEDEEDILMDNRETEDNQIDVAERAIENDASANVNAD